MAAKKRTAKPTLRIKTQKEAAELLNVSPRSLRSWESEAWWPEGGRTKSGYDIARIRAAQEAHGKAGSDYGEKRKDLALKREQAKLEKELIDIERRRLELQARETLLIPRDAVELHLATLLKELGDLFDKLPTQAGREAGKKNAAKVEKYLANEFDKARRRIAGELERAAREADALRESS